MMLSPLATTLIIKHFDAIDKVLSGKLSRTSVPWNEIAINALFVDLFDAKVQEEVKLEFTLAELQETLLERDELTSVQLKIDTHSYSSYVEKYVTQSDIGLVIEYKDAGAPQNNRKICWLLQAKRAFPVTKVPLKYAPNSAFKSINQEQHERIEELQRLVGTDFIKYLLYCPRPEHLDPEERRQLTYHRTKATSGSIFDYALGLELRDEIMNGSPTLQAGVFIANSDDDPTDVATTHEKMFESTLPLSWFIANHFAESSWGMHPYLYDDSNSSNLLLERIVTGDEQVIQEISDHFGGDFNLEVLPPVTITISVSDGYLIQGRKD